MARASVVIHGRVQGVCYRAFTQDAAIRLGLKGWVRNLPDGNVEAVFEGPRDAIERVIEYCEQGPPLSRVTKIDLNWQDTKDGEGTFSDFRITF